ncbi:pentatricopeptide repeat-containing protein At3g12770-like [Coffea eugenioides]|uniref:pentatricopeptide repeat-containing protein At3g12770-like n=1 Tax=Coffea eugenioides TaxID=49369 RepID=UPI000F611379|nr:pentatricopeptide repeat-containing protein At3g12770-like [Coffea eugenioides]
MDVIAFPSTSTQTHYLFSSTSPENPPLNQPFPIIPNQTHVSRCKCSSVASSKLTKTQTHQLFDEIPLWDTFAWNNVIQTHLTNGDPRQVTSTYQRMLLLGVRPDRHTLPRVLAASRLLGNLSLGKQLHCHVIKFGFVSDAYVTSAIVDLYGQLEGVQAAKWYFKTANFDRNNAVAWTLLAGMFVKRNKPELAIDLFNEMIDHGGKIVDAVALVTVITACGMLKSLRDGRRIHQIAKDFGLDIDILVGNALVKMYIECGSIRDARAVFDGMRCKDAISWTAMINGYVKKGGFHEGLKLFRLMIGDGIKADAFAISSVLPGCARVAANKNGKEIHGHLIRNGIDMNVTVLNALMDMYVKSGSIEYASRVFAAMKDRDVISWTIMILGHSLHGQGKVGVDLYHEMVENSRLEADQMTLAAVLYACYSARMVEEGRYYFNCIRSPKVAHCALIVALLARAGLFYDAKAFIEERKISRQGEVLRALLDGCRVQRNTIRGKEVIEQLCDLEPLNTENYVLLSNWYAHHKNWDMADKYSETIKDMDLRPRKACSWIEFKNKIHVFRTGDASHPRSESVYSELQNLQKRVKAEGFQSADFSLHDVYGERECDPIGHSELLAVSFGLINRVAGQTIRVSKNGRVCQNCHSFVKAISKEAGVEIVLRDPGCFHHFKDGCCSCMDCW